MLTKDDLRALGYHKVEHFELRNRLIWRRQLAAPYLTGLTQDEEYDGLTVRSCEDSLRPYRQLAKEGK